LRIKWLDSQVSCVVRLPALEGSSAPLFARSAGFSPYPVCVSKIRTGARTTNTLTRTLTQPLPEARVRRERQDNVTPGGSVVRIGHGFAAGGARDRASSRRGLRGRATGESGRQERNQPMI